MRLTALLLSIGALMGSAARAGCTLETVATLPVHVEQGRIFLAGSINGHAVDFLVDPAHHSLILNSAEHDLDMPAPVLRRVTTLGTQPPLAATDLIAYLRRGSLANFGTPTARAMLGNDFLTRFDVEFDVANKRMVLFRPSGCDGVKEAYWAPRAETADMLPSLKWTPRHGNIDPYSPYDFPFVTIEAKVDGKRVRAIIDGGQRASFLSLTAAHDLGRDRDGMSAIAPTPDLFDGYDHPTWQGRFDSVTLAGETVAPAVMAVRSFLPAAGARAPVIGSLVREGLDEFGDMVLGADFLISHRVLFAFSQHKVYFTYAQNQLFLGGTPPLEQDQATLESQEMR